MRHIMPLLLLTLLGTAQASAQPTEPADPRRQLFEERRALESISHRERIRILQQADACIQAADSIRAYRACEQEEKAARQALRQRLRPQVQELRARFRALMAGRPSPGNRDSD
ncbi:MAG: hypothetical protein D6717_10020 [Gammaproteobacteria bacterium]|nr:MAG: hypothetical protein D6717_10020 [Gammaproteobacteria bacterium]